jgi:Fe2+ transport system protein FeoA
LRTISQIPINKKAKICAIHDQSIAQKLYSMGILPNYMIEVKRKTLNGNTFFLNINNHHNIAIRKDEAQYIIVEEQD